MNNNSKIYVAGHTGLVGSAITSILIERGYSNLLFRSQEELELTNQRAVDDFFAKEKPEYVLLAAAKVGGILANSTLRADFIYTNILIESNIIHSCWKNGIKKLLFLGSTCIYPKNAPQPLKEDYLLTSPLEYTNEPYAVAKIAGIKMCESYNIQYKTNFISVMPTNLYGPGDNYDFEKSHVLPALLRKFHLGICLEDNNWKTIRKDLDRFPVKTVDGRADEKTILSLLAKHGIFMNNKYSNRNKVTVTIWGTGIPLREFMYSKDLAEACVYIMENVDIGDIIKLHKSKHLEKDYHTPNFINIGTEEEISISELAEKIKNLTGFRGDIIFDITKPDGTMRKVTDAGILHGLGFFHKVNLTDGLKMTYEQYLRYK